MRQEDFSDQCPGRLEQTAFGEKHLRDGVPQVRPAQGYGFVPDPLPPRSLDRATMLSTLYDPLLAAERALSALDGSAQHMKNPHLLIGPFLFREAKHSSAIENTFASAQELALFEFDPSAVDDRDQVREVSNYIRALEHGLQSELPVCLRLIREMHSILLAGVGEKNIQRGAFRTLQNAIGGDGLLHEARFVPPPVEHLQACLSDFEKYMNKPKRPGDLPRLVRFALLHYQFETIHPFEDGNGRIGRLLVALLLCEQAQMAKPLVYVSGYFEQHREQYYDLLYRVSTQGKWFEWIEFFLTAIATQAHDALDRATRLDQLNQKYQRLVREKRASALLPKLIDRLFTRPSLTISDARKITGTTPNATSKTVLKLVEKGILIEATGRKKNRIFVAPEILDIIDS